MSGTDEAPVYGRRTFLAVVAGGVSALWWGPAAVRVGQDLLLPVAQVLPPGVGKPLTRPHGAPARVVIPDMYGYKNVKWVRRIELVSEPLDGYWEQRGYDRDAWVRA